MQQAFAGIDLSPVIPPWLLAGLSVVAVLALAPAFWRRARGAALRRVTRDLAIPPLALLSEDHVLKRSFYLLPDLPGRFAGGQVWVARDQDRANDSVSPVILGGHDWAAAWAIDARGNNPFAVIPGGTRQRSLAYRFGVNLVMYALTGNYKGDQVHVPAILERLGN